MTEAAYEEALGALAARREDVVVLTAENRAPIRGLAKELGPRFIDVGIAEQTLVGAAAGLALRGRTPVVHALASFLTMRAFEFIRTDVGIPGLPVKLVGYVPGLLSEANGPTHQALEDVALMRGIPGMKVFCPSDREELAEALPSIVEDRSPWYVRYTAAPATVPHRQPFVPGRAEALSAGDGVGILTYGILLREAEKARVLLESRGIPVRLVDLRTLQPVDEVAILSAARETRLLVTLEDHFRTGGLHSIVAELVVRHRLRPRLMPVAFEGRWFAPALLAEVLVQEGLTGRQIAERIFDELLKKED
jgi:transketolase